MNNPLSNNAQVRVCRCCQETKSLEMFFKQGIYIATVCSACVASLPEVPASKKRCSRCLEIKELGAFNFVKGKPHSYCRACQRQYRNGRHSSPKRRDENLRRNYGITSSEYDVMLSQQGGVCAACLQPETAIDPYTRQTKKLAVDHCHETGQIRELLCETCNKILGYIEKEPQRVGLLLEYLKRHSN